MFHRVFTSLMVTLTLASSPDSNYKLIFAHPDTVIYRVGTAYGKLSLYLRFPGLYEEATLADFAGVNQLIVDAINHVYGSASLRRGPHGLPEPISVYHHKRLGCFFEPRRPTPVEARDIIRSALRDLYTAVSRLTFRRMFDRVGKLSIHSHAFEKLVDDLKGNVDGKVSDDLHGVTAMSSASGFRFHQSLPLVELIVEGRSRGVKRSMLDMSAIVDFFNWSVLNSAISRRTYPDESLPTGPDVISDAPFGAKSEVKKHQLRLEIKEDGSISIECVSRKLRSALSVAARDSAYSREAGIETPGTVIWSGVYRVCHAIESAFALPKTPA